MGLLNLNFIYESQNTTYQPIENILHKYAKDLCDYAKGFFSYVVTSSGSEGVDTAFSLYILVPEIGYDYQILSIDIKDMATVKINYFTLKTKQVESVEVSVESNDYKNVDSQVKSFLESSLSNEIYTFLVEQVLAKRKMANEFE